MQKLISSKGIKIIPVGGCGEIGLNLTLIGIDGVWIAIDCGLMFPNSANLGVDAVLPSLEWFWDAGGKISGWVFTHGHEDHIGAFPWLYPKNPAPIFGTLLTLEIIAAKMHEHSNQKLDLREIVNYQDFFVGTINCCGVSTAHSIPDSCGIIVETIHGNMFFSGDFRFNSTADIFHKPIKALFADSTNALVPGRDRLESDLVDEFIELNKNTKGCVVAVLFASSLWRFKTIIAAAKQTGRKVYLLGKSVKRNLDLALKTNIFTAQDTEYILDDEQLHHYDKSKLVIIAAGSQGEIFSGAARLARGHVAEISIGEQDAVVFSSRTIPGNERAVNFLLNQFAKKNIHIVSTDGRKFHVSGHGFADDLQDLIRMCTPDYFVPIHGEFRQLQRHRELAIATGCKAHNCFLIENGTVLELSAKGLKPTQIKVPTDKKYVCDKVYTSAEIPKERLQLARSGVLFVACVLDEKTKKIILPAIISQKGIHISEDLVRKLVEKILQHETKSSKRNNEEELRILIRRKFAERYHGYKPIVDVKIVRSTN